MKQLIPISKSSHINVFNLFNWKVFHVLLTNEQSLTYN